MTSATGGLLNSQMDMVFKENSNWLFRRTGFFLVLREKHSVYVLREGVLIVK